MRTVTDPQGDTWICLELPDSPVVATTGTENVSVECNSGADRVVIVVPPAWDEWPDERLASEIRRTLAAQG
jgi:hypothetical protein